jgi:predicted extracellular nuclease
VSRRPLLAALVLAFSLALCAQASAAVVISELRFRGPSGANDEFVELLNTGTAPEAIGGLRLQGCAASGGARSTRATVPAGTSLPAGGRFLLANTASSGYSGAATPDLTYTTGFADTAGSQSGVVLTRADDSVVDGVGLPASPCREGAGVAFPTANADASLERREGGTQDTGDNAADFVARSPSAPQGSGGSGGGGDPQVTPISAVQGAGATSPLVGTTVTVEGVVTGVDDEVGASFGDNNSVRIFGDDAGIYLQSLPGAQDADAATSEGLFVGFVRGPGGDREALIGKHVRLRGQVVEKFGFTQVNILRGTEPEILGGAALPAPVVIDPALAAAQTVQAGGTRTYYESLEGMRVTLAVGTANSGGTNKFGELFLTPGTTQDRVFRTEDPAGLIAVDADAGAGDPDNPYRPTAQNTAYVAADLFDRVENATGPLGFSFSNYKILVQPGALPTVTDSGVAFPYQGVPDQPADTLRITAFNVENLFPVGGQLDGGTVSAEEYAERRDEVAAAISERLKRPDVVAVEEVVNLAVLRDLAATLGGYSAYLEEGNDERGIDVGFLIKDTVTATNVRQLGKTATESLPARCSDVPGGLFDRPPLAVDVTGANGLELTVIVNHFSSKGAPDECREAQAAFVRDEVVGLEAAGRQVVVGGDLNAFEDESALTTLQDGRTSLTNLWDRAPEQERYSFAFQGRLQTLDHLLVTDGLDAAVLDFRYAHFDNDFHDREGVGGGHKASDHDPPIVTLADPNDPVAVDCGGPLVIRKKADGTRTITAADPDGRVTRIALLSGPAGLTLGTTTAAGADGASASATLTVGDEVKKGSYEVRVRASNDDASPQAAECTLSVRVVSGGGEA